MSEDEYGKPLQYKNPVGRPTKYDPKYCEEVLRMGAQGYSVVEMAAEIGVKRDTLETNWPDKHPDFLEAFTQAMQLSQSWWEKQGRIALFADKFQNALWARSMAARFPKDWRESKNIDHSGQVAVESTKDTQELTKALAAALRAKKAAQ